MPLLQSLVGGAVTVYGFFHIASLSGRQAEKNHQLQLEQARIAVQRDFLNQQIEELYAPLWRLFLTRRILIQEHQKLVKEPFAGSVEEEQAYFRDRVYPFVQGFDAEVLALLNSKIHLADYDTIADYNHYVRSQELHSRKHEIYLKDHDPSSGTFNLYHLIADEFTFEKKFSEKLLQRKLGIFDEKEWAKNGDRLLLLSRMKAPKPGYWEV